ncbi:type II secretion system F family protein [Candidatus Margulisiibacteriota bacterium]
MSSILFDYQSLKRFSTFCFKLRDLLKAGIALSKAIQIIITDESNKEQRSRLTSLAEDLKSGKNLLRAFKKMLPENIPFNFSQVEKLPDIEELLGKLGDYYQQKLKSLNIFLKKIAYPFFLILTTAVIFFIFIFILLPNFRSFYQDLNLELPGVIRLILNLTSFIDKYAREMIVLLFGSVLIFYSFSANKIKMLIANLLFPESVSDILWILGIFLKSGLVMKEAINCFSHKHNPEQEIAYNKFKDSFLSSGDFSGSFLQSYELSSYQQELLRNAQKTGKLADTFFKISQDIKTQERRKTDRALSLVQPILLSFIGIMVFLFIYFTFLPVLSSINSY